MTREEAIKVLENEWKCIDRNDGIHCDRDCGKCDLVMETELIRQAYNLAIEALSQPEIIRCKDCKYAQLTYRGECKYCDIWFPDEKCYMDGNYFCASAERRTNESD